MILAGDGEILFDQIELDPKYVEMYTFVDEVGTVKIRFAMIIPNPIIRGLNI